MARRGSVVGIGLIALLLASATASRSGGRTAPASAVGGGSSARRPNIARAPVEAPSPSPTPAPPTTPPSPPSQNDFSPAPSASKLLKEAPTNTPEPDSKRGAARYGLGFGRFARTQGSSSAAKSSGGVGAENAPTKAALPPPDSVRLRPRVVTLNIMVAGLSGLGKTTSCASLFESWRGDDPSSRGGGRRHDFAAAEAAAAKLRKSTAVVDASRHFERYDAAANTILRVRIVDTPGFGNRVDHRHAVRPIARYVASCRDRQYRAETSPSLPNADSGREGTDHLVHVCLYFLGPGRFLEIDRHFLRRIQREVAVVPVIAKADTLTDVEIARYRAELRHAFDRERIEAYDFDADYYRRGGGGLSSGDDALSASAPPLRRGRRPGEPLAVVSRDGLYPWGKSRSYDPDHSDLALVRDLLLSEHTERLVELAREKYGTYRARRIRTRRVKDAARYVLTGFLAVRALGSSDEGVRRAAGKLSSDLVEFVKRVVEAVSVGFGIKDAAEEAETNEAPKASALVTEDPAPTPTPRRGLFRTFGLIDDSPQSQGTSAEHSAPHSNPSEKAETSSRQNRGFFGRR